MYLSLTTVAHWLSSCIQLERSFLTIYNMTRMPLQGVRSCECCSGQAKNMLGLCGLGNSGVPGSESEYGLGKSGAMERRWSGMKRTKSGVERTRSGIRSTHGGGLLRSYWQRTGSRLSVLNLEVDGDVGVRSTGVRTRSSERRIGKNGDETETRIQDRTEFGVRRSEVGDRTRSSGKGI
ncbi:hypothetical protein OH77DRAFT_1215380 [Trametes cingulata]|nr:hypothetical protein OH77DRAFT_1215380 [Trametes cingulata]